MKIYPQPANYTNLLMIAGVVTLLGLSATPLRAQARGSYERVLRERNADMMREMEIRRRELDIKNGSNKVALPTLAVQQIKEDFRRLQIVNLEMLKKSFPEKGQASALDYAHISKGVAEIRKRASRLHTNLQLPKPEGEEKPQSFNDISSEKQLKASLLALDNLIMSFVSNPAFRGSGGIDAQHSARARRDLLDIIELSRLIKQSAERLGGSPN